MNKLTAVTLIFVILLIASVYYTSRKAEISLLTGVWIGGSSFCENANLKKLFMYVFDQDSIFSHSREAYIIMETDEIIIDQLVRLNFTTALSANPFLADELVFQMNIDFLNNQPTDDSFPTNQTIHYYPKRGKLLFTNGDVLHAVFYKDNAAGDL